MSTTLWQRSRFTHCDAALKRQVEAYLAADEDSRAAPLDTLIYRWSGSEGVTPQSRGGNVDARKRAAR